MSKSTRRKDVGTSQFALESCDHIITTMLYGKETFILEDVTTPLLSNEIRKRPNQEEQEGSGLMVIGRKGREKKRKVRAHRKRVTFVNRKVTERRIASIDKSD